MEWVDAIVLGLVQGITEFLPVSSSGHLVLVRDWLSTGAEMDFLAFDAVLHFATTGAVILYFRQDIWNLLQVALRKLGRLPVNQRDITLLYALVIGTIPASILGFFLESVITEYLRTPVFVAIVLFLVSIFFMYAEWRYYLAPAHGEMTLKHGFLVGVFQALALIPGMSRSGATIAGGMLLGLSRYEATRFSFLLAIPITLAAGAKKSLDLLEQGATVDWLLIGAGAGVAFITALIVIHFFLNFIRKYTLWPFVWYGIILAGMVGYVTLFT
ncbi:undecaprenyl-diphosphatase UppP [Candidatus Kaiserbacteria bacterium]|nr:undecaprenyl-diphosphatase UppP [Candidatus Kaiserbacteria bacterium]USN91910.1 MAG: undecaprenyl-diphosphatase UppP [Candidatus Nomurabacteria bacterium]